MRVRADLNISLDGIAATADGTPENPFGEDWGRLVAAYLATRTMQDRVMGDTTGAGTTGVDDTYAAAYFDGIGAEIMGAGKFGLHTHPDDADWRGWWGDNPPFHYPVFVLTHGPRPDLEMEGGTTFHFLTATPQEALERAQAVAGDKDVRIGGGPTVLREFLEAGLIDQLHVAIAPIVLGKGISVWDGQRGLDQGFDVTTEVAPESGTVHVTFTRVEALPIS